MCRDPETRENTSNTAEEPKSSSTGKFLLLILQMQSIQQKETHLQLFQSHHPHSPREVKLCGVEHFQGVSKRLVAIREALPCWAGVSAG